MSLYLRLHKHLLLQKIQFYDAEGSLYFKLKNFVLRKIKIQITQGAVCAEIAQAPSRLPLLVLFV